MSRLAEYVPIVSRLLAGERVPFTGRFYRLEDASVLTTAPAPPLWVAASGPKMLELTARHAAGWNAAWGGANTAWFEAAVTRLREAERRLGRRQPVVTSAGVNDVAGLVAGGPQELARMADGYGRAGADHLILNFGPAPFVAVSYLSRNFI